MRGLSIWLAALLAGGAAGAADLSDELVCRAQVLYECTQATCDAANWPVDLALNLSAGTGSLCRGEGCVEGTVKSQLTTGQWDDAPYLLFFFSSNGKEPETMTGIISRNTHIIHAMWDSDPFMGSCSPAEEQ